MTHRSLSPRNRRAVQLGLTLVVPSLLYVGAIKPYTAVRAETRGRLTTEREALARERALLTLVPQSVALSAALDSVMQAGQERLFAARDNEIATAELVTYLTQIARNSQVWLRAAEPRETKTSPNGVRALAVEIQAESDFAGVLTFLRALEQGAKLVRLDRLNLIPGTDTSASRRPIQVQATVVGYALGDVAAVAQAAQGSRP